LIEKGASYATDTSLSISRTSVVLALSASFLVLGLKSLVGAQISRPYQSLKDLQDVISMQIAYYNQDRRHSALAYRTPIQVVNEFLSKNITTDS
jgi:hypothetical protein